MQVNISSDVVKNRDLGRSISRSLVQLAKDNKKERTDLDDPPTYLIPLDNNGMCNIRDNFYLKIIDKQDAKDKLLHKLRDVTKGLEESGDLKTYRPTDINPIYVFKNGELITKITSEIVTVGSYVWNTIVGDKKLGVSRIHAIIMFMKDKNDKIQLIVLDAWSQGGSYVIDKMYDFVGISKGDNRNVLITEISDCVRLKFCKEIMVFSTISGKSCIVCMNAIREVRYECGHGVVCKKCSDVLSLCPICRIPLSDDLMEMTMCDKTYKSYKS